MSVTKQTTVWCDHPMEGGMTGHHDDDTLRCVAWVSVDSIGTREARREAKAQGWSFRAGIGDCCPNHSAALSAATPKEEK